MGCLQLPLIGILRDSVGSVLIARVSLLQSKSEEREILQLAVRVMRKLAAVYWPLYAYLIVMGREFLTVLFTSRYRDSWPIFAVNLTLVPLNMLVTDPVIRAYAEHRYFMLRLRIVTLLLLAAGLWWGTARYGMLGAVTVVVGITLLEYAIVVHRVARILRPSFADLPLLFDVGKLAAAAAIAGLCAAILRAVLPSFPPWLLLAVTAPVFAVVYLGGVFLMGVPDEDERSAIRRQFAKLRRAIGASA